VTTTGTYPKSLVPLNPSLLTSSFRPNVVRDGFETCYGISNTGIYVASIVGGTYFPVLYLTYLILITSIIMITYTYKTQNFPTSTAVPSISLRPPLLNLHLYRLSQTTHQPRKSSSYPTSSGGSGGSGGRRSGGRSTAAPTSNAQWCSCAWNIYPFFVPPPHSSLADAPMPITLTFLSLP
jgi:hypothetical protein